MGGLGMSLLQANTSDDTRGAVRAELKALQSLTGRPAPNKAAKAHLDDLKDQIARILDPKFLAAPILPGTAPAGRRAAETCWPGVEDIQD
jgi:hypothetical protein